MTERKMIERKNWVSNFNLIGLAKINDYTFKIGQKSEKSAWNYNSLSLSVDCGKKCGLVGCEMMGGYSDEGQNVIFVHGKKDDGSDDFSKKIQVDWEDRFDEDILKTIGDLCFVTVGLEKTPEDTIVVKKFLSTYDAIAYIQEHLENNTVVNVKGNLKYSMYKDSVQVRKNITSIFLSKIDDEEKHIAKFTQSVLLDKDSVSLKNINKEDGSIYIDAKVLDYVKELNGVEIKGQYPFEKQFEYKFPDIKNAKQCRLIIDKLFRVKKGVTQITFNGNFVEGGSTVKATIEDIPQDIRDLIESGIYTEEEALVCCSTNGKREHKMYLCKPVIKMIGDDDEKMPVVQKFEEQYTEDELVFDLTEDMPEDTKTKEDVAVTAEIAEDDMSWLDNL